MATTGSAISTSSMSTPPGRQAQELRDLWRRLKPDAELPAEGVGLLRRRLLQRPRCQRLLRRERVVRQAERAGGQLYARAGPAAADRFPPQPSGDADIVHRPQPLYGHELLWSRSRSLRTGG